MNTALISYLLLAGSTLILAVCVWMHEQELKGVRKVSSIRK